MKDQITDKLLLDCIRRKNSKAFNYLYNTYARMLYNFVSARIKDRLTVEDILQNFWMKVWNDPDFIKVNEKDSAKNFMLQFLRYRIHDVYREIKPVFESLEEVPEEERALYHHIIEQIDTEVLIRIIDDVLMSMPTLTRAIFWMRIDNYSVEQTAHELSISTRSVYNKYSESLKAIRQHLTENYPEFTHNISMDKLKDLNYNTIVLLFVLINYVK